MEPNTQPANADGHVAKEIKMEPQKQPAQAA